MLDAFVRRTRARRLRRTAAVLSVLVVVGAGAWAVLRSPWAVVGTIAVVTDDGGAWDTVDPQSVRDVVADQQGRPVLLVDTGAVARAVRGLRRVRTAAVHRGRGSLTVVVSERVAVAAVPSGDRYLSVDATGVTVARTAEAPDGLPVLQVDPDAAGGDVLRAALDVVSALPSGIGTVTASGASSRDGIWFQLGDDRRVFWGSSERTARKLEAVAALRRAVSDGLAPDRPTTTSKRWTWMLVLDVSAPDTPAMRWGRVDPDSVRVERLPG